MTEDALGREGKSVGPDVLARIGGAGDAETAAKRAALAARLDEPWDDLARTAARAGAAAARADLAKLLEAMAARHARERAALRDRHANERLALERLAELAGVKRGLRPQDICGANEEVLRAGQHGEDEIAVHLAMHAEGKCPRRSVGELAEYERRVVMGRG